MSLDDDIKKKIHASGYKSEFGPDVESIGAELTVCQLVVVIMSLVSVAFIVVPFLFLKNLVFMILFFALSMLSMGLGIWFWLNKGKYCEHPEEYEK